jgi:hypothetical protein
MAATKEYLQKVKPLTVADDEERQLNTKEGDHASTSSSSYYYYCYYYYYLCWTCWQLARRFCTLPAGGSEYMSY